MLSNEPMLVVTAAKLMTPAQRFALATSTTVAMIGLATWSMVCSAVTGVAVGYLPATRARLSQKPIRLVLDLPFAIQTLLGCSHVRAT